jgi:hypothetical protein
MAQIPLPDNLLARLRRTAQQDGLSLPRLFEKMLDAYLMNRSQASLENLNDTVESLSTTESSDPLQREIAAFMQLHAWLLEHYANQYVAIYQGKLVDHDADKLALWERIENAHPNEFVLMRPVRQQPERKFYFRSPQYVESRP